MARTLRTYRTSIGFFDLAVAAPSMKAALAAWGARTNLFHQGFATPTDDAAIVAATMAKPGVVLRRAVGSKGEFRERAELPRSLPAAPAGAKRKKPAAAAPIDARAARRAAVAFERQQRRADSERLKRQRALARARAALEKARRDHDKRRRAIDAGRAALDKRARAEDARWAKRKAELESAIRRMRT